MRLRWRRESYAKWHVSLLALWFHAYQLALSKAYPKPLHEISKGLAPSHFDMKQVCHALLLTN